MKKRLTYKRILLKLSGEALAGKQKLGIAKEPCQQIALAIKALRDAGLEVAIVIGGGNIFRGVSLKELGIAQTPADQMGMLATLMNGVALQQALIAVGCKTRLFSGLECPQVAETYQWKKALEAIEEGAVLIFVGGTGNPYFTTDTAAALRANEIEAEILLKATKVDGVFNKDPLKHRDAHKYDTLAYSQVLAEKLEVMDATAIALCMTYQIPILVFNMQLLHHKEILNVLSEQQGTLVHCKGVL
jgi:uridylate kinase